MQACTNEAIYYVFQMSAAICVVLRMFEIDSSDGLMNENTNDVQIQIQVFKKIFQLI